MTKAATRLISVPGLAKQVALITLDNGHDHTRPSTFGPQGLISLNAAIDEAFAADPAAIAVTGKPFIFAVGADLKGVEVVKAAATRWRSARPATTCSGGSPRCRSRPSPSSTARRWAAASRSALHCTYRTVCSGVPALAFPECFLGLVPGWGGCTLLPNLIGPDAAVTVIIENALSQNRKLKGPQAFELGIADAIFEPADFLEQSLLWAAGVLNGEHRRRRPEIDRGEAGTGASPGRAIADSKVHGAAPAAVPRAGHLDAGRDSD